MPLQRAVSVCANAVTLSSDAAWHEHLARRRTRLGIPIVALAVLVPAIHVVLATGQPPIEDLEAMRSTDTAALLVLLDRELADIAPDADPRRVANLFRLRAETLRERGEYERARQDATGFQHRAQALDDPVLIARALMLHGTIDAEQNDIAQALDRFHEARQLLEATDRTRELARVNNAIGVAHNFALDFARARHYYEEALRLARRAGDEALESAVLGNLALAVSETDGPAAGLPMHREARALADTRGDTHGVALQTANICERLLQVGQIDEARTTCLASLEQLSTLQITRPLAGVRMTLGDISRADGKPREAVEHYTAALDAAAGAVPKVELALHQRLSAAHEALGETAAALRELQAMVALSDELLARERQSMVEELEVKYKVEKRERQLELMTLDSRLQETQLRNRTLMLLATAVALALSCLGGLIAWRGYRTKRGLEHELASRNQALETALEQISTLARTDELTGLWNRRAFEELASAEVTRATRTGQPLSLAMADIDWFKALNDRLGHHAGDEVLKAVSRHLRKTLRRADLVCRWGGEEFLCLLPDNDAEATRQAMERVRQKLASEPPKVGEQAIFITMTIGIATLRGDLDTAIREADAAMYEGKRSGRDQIVVAALTGGADRPGADHAGSST